MMGKTGLCGAVLCECLADYMDETGNDDPSKEAVKVALEWEQNPDILFETILKSGKWCMSPNISCLLHCKMWKKDFNGRWRYEK